MISETLKCDGVCAALLLYFVRKVFRFSTRIEARKVCFDLFLDEIRGAGFTVLKQKDS